jgi:hypothetical protein
VLSSYCGLTRISHKLEGQRGRGAEGIELGTLNSPLLKSSPAQEQKTLRDVVRNPGLEVTPSGASGIAE